MVLIMITGIIMIIIMVGEKIRKDYLVLSNFISMKERQLYNCYEIRMFCAFDNFEEVVFFS